MHCSLRLQLLIAMLNVDIIHLMDYVPYLPTTTSTPFGTNTNNRFIACHFTLHILPLIGQQDCHDKTIIDIYISGSGLVIKLDFTNVVQWQ